LPDRDLPDRDLPEDDRAEDDRAEDDRAEDDRAEDDRAEDDRACHSKSKVHPERFELPTLGSEGQIFKGSLCLKTPLFKAFHVSRVQRVTQLEALKCGSSV